jgi:hypothetical protein
LCCHDVTDVDELVVPRVDPVVAIETLTDKLRRLKALYIDCGEKDQFNLLYVARRFVPRLSSGSGSDEPMCSRQAGGRGTVQDHLKRSTYIYKTAAGGFVGCPIYY